MEDNKKNFSDTIYSCIAFLLGIIAVTLLLFTNILKSNDITIKGSEFFFGSQEIPLIGFIGFIRVFFFILILISLLLIIISNFIKNLRSLTLCLLIVSSLMIVTTKYYVDYLCFNNGIYLSYTDTELTFSSYISIFLLIISSFLEFVVLARNEKFNNKEIAQDAILIALAIICQYIKVYSTDFGSINLQIVPLSFIALRNKPSKTFICCGLIFGLITCLLDGYGLASFPLEYLVAFGSLAILSLFRNIIFRDNKPRLLGYIFIALGVILASLVRYLCCAIDAMVLYGIEDISVALIGASIPTLCSGLFALIFLEILYIKPIFSFNKSFPLEK